MYVTLVNNDPFGNIFRVTDENAGHEERFSGFIGAHGEETIFCQENDSGFGNIITYQDGNPGIGRSFLHDGDRIDL